MVAVKMGGMMPPMGGMPQPMNMMPPPMPVPPMGQQMMPPQPMPMQQGAGPVAPQARSNAGRRKRFGDSLESMLSSGRQPVASDQMAGMNVFTGQMPRRPMPRGQMMGGTAMQPPVRRMMGGGPVSVPRETDIYGQPHMLAYINPEEADLLQGLGGMGTPGPGGVPQYNWFTDFISNITGGGSSSSSSSSSGGGQDNNPNAGDGGGPAKNANQVYADSMKAGGGGTNLSGSGSSAMADLVAAQQAQTQKDDDRPSSSNVLDPFGGAGPDITPTTTSDPLDPFGGAGPDVTSSSPTYGIPSNTEGDPFDRPPNTGVVGGYDPIGGGSVDDVGIGQPIGDPGDASNINIFTTPIDIPPVGDPDDASNIDLLTTLPVTGGDNNTSPNEQEPINLDPVVYYDDAGNPHSSQAAANAANDKMREDAQRAAEESAAAAEAERIRMEQFAQLEAQAAADAERAEAARRKIAQQAAANQESSFDRTVDPLTSDASYFGDLGGNQVKKDDPMTMQESSFDYSSDPINEGLGKGVSLDKEVTKTGTGDDEEKKGFIDQFKDDAKEFGNSFVNDVQMGIAAGLFGSRATRFQRLIDAGYSKEQANSFLDRSEQTMKDMMDKQAQQSAQDDDGGSTPVVDPCPEGFKLDSASGICVPVEDTSEDDTEEDTDEEEDTSDDELSGVVTTPPPPTSYLDNPIRAMNRGGSVGLNRAADNFLAAMGG